MFFESRLYSRRLIWFRTLPNVKNKSCRDWMGKHVVLLYWGSGWGIQKSSQNLIEGHWKWESCRWITHTLQILKADWETISIYRGRFKRIQQKVEDKAHLKATFTMPYWDKKKTNIPGPPYLWISHNCGFNQLWIENTHWSIDCSVKHWTQGLQMPDRHSTMKLYP